MNINKLYHLGIALGGGGARGFVHLGVLQALQELGIHPDIISGTSAGALVGAMIASGHTPLQCLDFFKQKRIRDFIRPAMSRKGFFTMNNLEEDLEEFLGVKTFEELETPLIITASDMNNGRPVHFSSGKLLPAVIASCSIPVVFVPKEIDGIEYTDGGAFMNLPVRPIRPQCEQIIAVEINSFDTTEKISNMVSMAIRTFHIGLARNTDIDRAMADIVIAPQDMTQYNVFALKESWDIFKTGYNLTLQLMDKRKEQPLYNNSL